MNKYLPEVEVQNLPSKKLQYPGSVKVFYNPYTFGDLLAINSSAMNSEQLYEYILKGVRVVGMDKMDLTFYDVSYLGWLRKVSSLGTPMFKLSCFCPNCDMHNSKVMALNEMDFDDVEVPAMPIRVKIKNIDLSFKYITIKEHLELLASGDIEDILAVIAKHVENLEYTEAQSLIFNLVGQEVETVKYINRLLYHGLSDVKFECSNEECKFEYLVNPADYTEAEVEKPFCREDSIIRNEISFG